MPQNNKVELKNISGEQLIGFLRAGGFSRLENPPMIPERMRQSEETDEARKNKAQEKRDRKAKKRIFEAGKQKQTEYSASRDKYLREIDGCS